MNQHSKTAALSVLCLVAGTNAFVAPSRITRYTGISGPSVGALPAAVPQLSSTSSSRLYSRKDDEEQDNEIERLKAMAAKLRAEAAELEAEKKNEMAMAAEKAFNKFDLNKDGQISTAELKSGLEKALKTDLSDARVSELMSEFDKDNTGSLRLDEFVTVDQFRNRLEALAREEKRRANEAATAAKLQEEEAVALQASLDLLNDKPPSIQDKAVSLLPYLFPLLDGLQFGRFLLNGQEDNPFVGALAIIYTLYRSVPFSGFIVFFLLNFLSSNPSLNRLVRFNMQQAIFLDIALFFPGLIAGIYSLVVSGLGGGGIPPELTILGTDVMFVTLLAAIGYSIVSSLLGIEPDKIPIVSQAVMDRMPTVDMFDKTGRFIPRQLREEKKNKDKKDKEKKDD